MKNFEEIRHILANHKEELERNYCVKQMGVFGSYVRGKQKKKSDLDILVEFKEPIGLFKFMELEDYLSKILNVKVDLVTRAALKPHISERVLKEVVYL